MRGEDGHVIDAVEGALVSGEFGGEFAIALGDYSSARHFALADEETLLPHDDEQPRLEIVEIVKLETERMKCALTSVIGPSNFISQGLSELPDRQDNIGTCSAAEVRCKSLYIGVMSTRLFFE